MLALQFQNQSEPFLVNVDDVQKPDLGRINFLFNETPRIFDFWCENVEEIDFEGVDEVLLADHISYTAFFGLELGQTHAEALGVERVS